MFEVPSSSSARSRRLVVALLVLIAFALPASRYLTRLADFGVSPANDYFPTVDLLRNGLSWSTNPLDWFFVQSNEHRCLIPALVYRANAALLDGDNRGHGAWGLLMMAVTGMALISLLPTTWRRRPWAVAPVALVIGIFAFPPLAAHNIALGFSGVMWLTANALVLSALAVVHNFPRSDKALAVTVGLGVCAHYTYSSGLMVWPTLLLVLLVQGQGKRRLGLVAGMATVLVALSVFGYRTPAGHPELNPGTNLRLLLRYTSVYMGSPFFEDEAAADVMGNLAMGAGALSFLLGLGLARPRERRFLLAPWWAVLFYAAVNIVGTGVGRSGFGAAQALASRYGSISGLFWIGVLVPPMILCFERLRSERPKVAWVSAAWLLFIVCWTHPVQERGGIMLDKFVERASFQPVGFALLDREIPDPALLRNLTARPDQLWKMRDFLEAQGLAPYHREPEPWPEGTLPLGATYDALGSLESAFSVPQGWVRLSGWVHHPEREIAEIHVADAEGNILGKVIHGTSRVDRTVEFGPGARRSGFFAYVRASTHEVVPRIFLRLEGDELFSELPWRRGYDSRWSAANCGSLASADAPPFARSR